jgi:SAM-dependent methyltransferase
MTEWFEQWFGEEYLRLYPHRDDHDASAIVRLIAQAVGVSGKEVLDLACGPGRHAAQFAQQGAHVVGLDLSLPLLGRARARTRGDVRLVRADMRHLPFTSKTFDLIVNLFTSFGYFGDDTQHEMVVRQAAGLLRANGVFVIDYLNATAVRAHLVAHEERVAGSQRISIKRRITDDGHHVVKEMRLLDDGRSFHERVRLFSADDLEQLLRQAGLTICFRFGDYDGSPVDADAPRVILGGRRA